MIFFEAVEEIIVPRLEALGFAAREAWQAAGPWHRRRHGAPVASNCAEASDNGVSPKVQKGGETAFEVGPLAVESGDDTWP